MSKRGANRFELIVALLSFVDEQGHPLESLIKAHLDWLKLNGVDGILVAGTTGEFPHMTVEQRQRYLDVVMQHNPGLSVMVQIGTTNLPDTQTLQAHALSHQPTSILWMPPFYYSQPELNGLDMFLQTLLDAQPESIPFYAYHLPKYSGMSIEAEWLNRFDRLAGLKDSSGDFDRIRQLRDDAPDKVVYPGTDYQIQVAKSLGCQGMISGLGNVFPHLQRQAIDTPNVKVEHCLKKLRTALSTTAKIPALKTMVAHLGLIEGLTEHTSLPSLLPMHALSEAQHQWVIKHVEQTLEAHQP